MIFIYGLYAVLQNNFIFYLGQNCSAKQATIQTMGRQSSTSLTRYHMAIRGFIIGYFCDALDPGIVLFFFYRLFCALEATSARNARQTSCILHTNGLECSQLLRV